jgi:hypothetical protein
MVSCEERLAAVEARLTAHQEGMATMNTAARESETDLRGDIRALDERMERRFDALDRRFFWVIALQFTTLLAALTAAIGILGQRL